MYDAYDYSNALQFHGHAIARRIAIVENSVAVATVELAIYDLTTTDTNYGPAPDSRLVQRDVFINVQFVSQ